MTEEQLNRLTPNASYVVFAGYKYRYAGRYPEGHILRNVHAMIYDEPPSCHVDSINISSLEYLTIDKYATCLTEEQIALIKQGTIQRLNP